MVRSAGGYAQLMAKEGKYAQLRLPSGEARRVLLSCMATIGQVGNTDHQNITLGKAGRKRWLGRRPEVPVVSHGSRFPPAWWWRRPLWYRYAWSQDTLGQARFGLPYSP